MSSTKTKPTKTAVLYETTVFLQNVHRQMVRKGITKAKLGHLTGIQASNVNTLLSGSGNISVRTAVRISTALNTPLWKLFKP